MGRGWAATRAGGDFGHRRIWLPSKFFVFYNHKQNNLFSGQSLYHILIAKSKRISQVNEICNILYKTINFFSPLIQIYYVITTTILVMVRAMLSTINHEEKVNIILVFINVSRHNDLCMIRNLALRFCLLKLLSLILVHSLLLVLQITYIELSPRLFFCY